MDTMLDVAVGFFTFNRLDTTVQVFEQIRIARPKKLYLVSDGPRDTRPGEAAKVQEVRDYLESHIDWPCEVIKNYAPKNMGCKNRMASGITWIFEHEEMAIILEDDVKPTQDFFRYAKEMLERYKDDERVMTVSGFKLVSNYPIKDSYTFSYHPMIWGWATWRRAWKHYDIDIKGWEADRKNKSFRKYFNFWGYKAAVRNFDSVYNHVLDTWDYQWVYTGLKYDGLTIIPKVNLIENLGFGRADATHTTGNTDQDFTTYALEFPLVHPASVAQHVGYDRAYLDSGWGAKTLVQRKIAGYIRKFRKLMRLIGQVFTKSL